MRYTLRQLEVFVAIAQHQSVSRAAETLSLSQSATSAALAELAILDLDGLDPRLAQLTVQTAVDVDNPLLGPRGASAIFVTWPARVAWLARMQSSPIRQSWPTWE